MLLNQRTSIKKRWISLNYFLLLWALLGIAKTQGQKSYRDSLVIEVQRLQRQPDFQIADSVYLSTLADLAEEYRYFHLDSLKIIAEQVMSISQKYNVPHAKANAHWLLGSYHSDKGNQAKAKHHYQTMLELCKANGFIDMELRALSDLGFEYENKGKYAMALETYLKALELATAYGNMDMLSIINENMANRYVSQRS
jgi:tetratricopeptide (TPR) repeat protein